VRAGGSGYTRPVVLAQIKLLCLDVDGVLTDGGIAIDDAGHETKRFHVRDGAALRMWARLGYETAVITGRNGMALRHRLRELGVRHVVSGSKEKGAAFEALLGEVGIAAGAVAMIGDDLPDLPILRRCGLPIAVRDAAQEVLDIAKFVTARPGGSGAVREAVEHILKGQGRWTEAVRTFDREFADAPQAGNGGER
jgi:3-deoxy-D-manno-octulosonate 8-phosphate phosphatase (KDO 8-P phosphatase)